MLVGEGQVKPFDGDMKDYYKYILEIKKYRMIHQIYQYSLIMILKSKIENYLQIKENS